MMIYTIAPGDFSARFHVSSCIIESDGEILLLHRSDSKPQGNTWCLPGGKVDGSETALDAIVRETHEETGIVLAADALAHLRTVPVRYAEYDFMYHVFRVCYRVRPDVVIRPDEHKAYRWLRPQDALSLPLIEDEAPCIRFAYYL